jgi:hypothetical protein
MRQRPQGPTSWLHAACLCTALACFLPPEAIGQTAPPLSRAEAVRAAQVLVTWFECEECEAGELRAVTRYGQAIVPSLIATLNEGPSPASREILRQQMQDRYDELATYAQKNPNAKLASGREEFVAMYLGNFDAQYRVRAAQALGTIGGGRAREALQSALQKTERSDVRRTISEALSKIKN